eukprot:1160626-Pelagomonas_calceolata.AAC.13
MDTRKIAYFGKQNKSSRLRACMSTATVYAQAGQMSGLEHQQRKGKCKIAVPAYEGSSAEA